jgi:hypothetical protein
MQLSKLERALVDSDLIIVDPENTHNEKDYDIMVYIRKDFSCHKILVI